MNDPKKNTKGMDVMSHIADEPESTDVLGSYTGTAVGGEDPVQDQDDL